MAFISLQWCISDLAIIACRSIDNVQYSDVVHDIARLAELHIRRQLKNITNVQSGRCFVGKQDGSLRTSGVVGKHSSEGL